MKKRGGYLAAFGIFLGMTVVSGCGSVARQGDAPAQVPTHPIKQNSDGTLDWKGLAAFTGESPKEIAAHIGESLPGTHEANLNVAALGKEIDAQISIHCNDTSCTVQAR